MDEHDGGVGGGDDDVGLDHCHGGVGGLVGGDGDVAVGIAGDAGGDEFGAEEGGFGPFRRGFVEVLEEGGLVDVGGGEVEAVDVAFTDYSSGTCSIVCQVCEYQAHLT